MNKQQLKQIVEKIVIAQGNHFIKELLRVNEIAIGTNKADFLNNINAAIDSEQLTQSMLEDWLKEVEGWGNQHLYLFDTPAGDPAEIQKKLVKSPHAALLKQGFGYEYPEDLRLSNIELDDEHLSLVWQQSRERWLRFRANDHVKFEGLDRYRYDAYRHKMDRSTVRFEWRFQDSFSGILVHRNKKIDHGEAKLKVWEVLKDLDLCDNSLTPMALNEAVKSASRGQAVARSARLGTAGGYVDLVSTLAEGGIGDVEAVRRARLGIDDGAFGSAQGSFNLDKEQQELTKNLSVQVYGSQGRIAIWAQCTRSDVYHTVNYLLQHNGN